MTTTVQTRQAIDPRHAKGFDTAELRAEFLIESAFVDGEVNLVYSHYDRMIVGGAVPAGGSLTLESIPETGTPGFRRPTSTSTSRRSTASCTSWASPARRATS